MAIAAAPVNHAVLPARIASFYIALPKWKEVARHTRILVNDLLSIRFDTRCAALLTVLPVLVRRIRLGDRTN
ncbi:hypothetical protein [Leptolyngbya ohadii]|uniref:hypothetical protein n=1 Tax=Leptolyngbya ohadii TaxID=1962290 RepID=UPI000B5A1459|nr:hypothetical protein [Leptolyngbya ohadii]